MRYTFHSRALKMPSTGVSKSAVQRGVQVLAELRKPFRDEKQREMLFGKTQYERR